MRAPSRLQDPSTALAIALALFIPEAKRRSLRVSRILPTPIVIAQSGTSSFDPKKRLFSRSVSRAAHQRFIKIDRVRRGIYELLATYLSTKQGEPWRL